MPVKNYLARRRRGQLAVAVQGLIMGGAVLLLPGGCVNCRTGTGGHAMELKETKDLVTMRGKPLVLLGNQPSPGDVAPDFAVVDAGFKAVRLADFKGKVCLISAVPSLDTQVCSLQTKRFNAEVGTLPADVVAMTISMDLPFAQKRFCEAEKVDRIMVLSDHVWRSFGTHYGIIVKDMGLLSRSVFVVGRDGRIAYRQLVPELSQQPDYDAALAAVRQAAESPP